VRGKILAEFRFENHLFIIGNHPPFAGERIGDAGTAPCTIQGERTAGYQRRQGQSQRYLDTVHAALADIAGCIEAVCRWPDRDEIHGIRNPVVKQRQVKRAGLAEPQVRRSFETP